MRPDPKPLSYAMSRARAAAAGDDRGHADDSAGADATDPLADLLFTLIAAVLPAILLLAPMTQRVERTAATRAAARRVAEARAGVTLRGVPVRPIVAGAAGLRIGGAAGRPVALDQIGDDSGLVALLEGMRQSGEPLLLLVEPDGLESAFMFDPVAAAHGPAMFDEIRATIPCATATDEALRAACGGGP